MGRIRGRDCEDGYKVGVKERKGGAAFYISSVDYVKGDILCLKETDPNSCFVTFLSYQLSLHCHLCRRLS